MAITDLHHDLDEHLAGPDPDWLDTDEPVIPAADKTQADRWLRKLAHLQADADEIDALYRAQLDQLNAWRDERLRVIGNAQARLEQSLAMFHAAALDLDPKAKTLSLPAGTLKARAQQPEWRYVNEAAFLEWAAANRPELVRRPEPVTPPPAVDRTAVKKVLRPAVDGPGGSPAIDPESGEVVPGVEVEHRAPKFTAEPNR